MLLTCTDLCTLAQVQGRVVDLAMSHTASRVIQACAKFGSDADRQALLTEAAPRVVDLAKSSYGHFLLSKLVTAAPKSQIAGASATQQIYQSLV